MIFCLKNWFFSIDAFVRKMINIIGFGNRTLLCVFCVQKICRTGAIEQMYTFSKMCIGSLLPRNAVNLKLCKSTNVLQIVILSFENTFLFSYNI